MPNVATPEGRGQKARGALGRVLSHSTRLRNAKAGQRVRNAKAGQVVSSATSASSAPSSLTHQKEGWPAATLLV